MTSFSASFFLLLSSALFQLLVVCTCHHCCCCCSAMLDPDKTPIKLHGNEGRAETIAVPRTGEDGDGDGDDSHAGRRDANDDGNGGGGGGGEQLHRGIYARRSRETLNTSSEAMLDSRGPLVIARGGSCGIFPDHTLVAYAFALNYSLPRSTALFCDLQLTKDGYGLCRTGLDLALSTSINITFPSLVNTYNVNGDPTTGFFSIDVTAAQVFNNLTATQWNVARSPYYDGLFPIAQPSDIYLITNNTDARVWLNIEYAEFYSQHNLSMSSYLQEFASEFPVDYISSPEVVFLKSLKSGLNVHNHSPKLILRIPSEQGIEPTTNVTYRSILNHLRTVTTYASGILVPKGLIWPMSNAQYLQAETALIREAHAAGLTIYASGFANDVSDLAYNYSFDPVREYLQFVPRRGSKVDGFLTDFPTTASDALACFRRTRSMKRSEKLPLVISHNGASGDYPGCTLLAYQGAIRDGASHIDCPIQMSADGIAFCNESPDLLEATDVSLHSDILQSRSSLIQQLQPSRRGVYSFNLTWHEISTLKASMYSPDAYASQMFRNRAYTQESIVSLTDFLAFAKNASVGIFIDIKNGYFLEKEVGLDVVDRVLGSLDAAGLHDADKVIIQSEDSAVLTSLKERSQYKLAFRVDNTNESVGTPQILEIKELAAYVSLPKSLIQQESLGYLVNDSQLVHQFHEHNVSVFASHIWNEFVHISFDHDSDPTLELHTFVQYFKVDGLITDFPATATAYLGNECLNRNGHIRESKNYQMRLVIPGELLSSFPVNTPVQFIPPETPLNVTMAESPLPLTFWNPPDSSSMPPSFLSPPPPPTQPPPLPLQSPSSSYKTSLSFIVASFALILYLLLYTQ